MKEFDIMTDGETGSIAGICDALAKNAINIKTLSINRGAVRIVTEDEKSTADTLKKMGISFATNDIMTLKMIDRPGELAKTMKLLAKYNVKIEAVYIYDKDAKNMETHVAFKVNDIAKAQKILG